MNKILLPRIARVIRSKNAGPYELTLDVIFKNARVYEQCKRRRVFNRRRMARLYRLSVADVLKIIHFDPCRAVKITLRRRLPSGAAGETDIYGAQQHAPLLGFSIDFLGK